ncbi:MAG TPA: hypothetical protein VHI54_09820 [Actinomycetota bacterium]|nr:hypothetical protein [Actinomycetota bacterium]
MTRRVGEGEAVGSGEGEGEGERDSVGGELVGWGGGWPLSAPAQADVIADNRTNTDRHRFMS